jgi:hypothetical protein
MRYGALILGLVFLAAYGCAAPEGPTELDVPAGSYAATFDAAREVLLDARFDLERVDATEGVISTRPKHSAGIMTPWDVEQSSAAQEFDDLANNQRRVVRVTFEPAFTAPATPAEPEPEQEPVDLRTGDAALKMNVRVIVLRDYRPGWQVQTSSVRLSTHTYDPALGKRGMLPDYEVAEDEDRGFAAWIVKRVEEEAGDAKKNAK